ncbi:MAG: DUF6364 family protein [Bacteroidota bacterium]
MNTKLTISMDEDVIDRAKNYAQSHRISLSRMIESYLDLVTKQGSERIAITPLVESLSGVIELPENYNSKKEYSDHIIEKYK